MSEILPKLYKYRYFRDEPVSRNGLPDGEQIPQWHQVLYDGLVFPAAPEDFNDPYDCDFLIEDTFINSWTARSMIVTVLLKWFPLSIAEKHNIMNAKDLEKAIKAVMRKYRARACRITKEDLMKNVELEVRKIKDAVSVACFSADNSSILMWSHYAANHTGFCIEYDMNSWYGKRYIKPVIYSDERHYIPGDFADNLTSNPGRAFMDAALFKSPEWSYEKEWRLIMQRIELINPQFKGTRPACFLKDYITAVYLGVKCSDNYRKQVYEHFKNTNVKVYQMEKQTDSYKLVPKIL